MVFLSPLPTNAELEAYYGEEYVTEYAGVSAAQRFSEDQPEAQIRLARLGDILQPSVRLLEVGCGSGAFLDAAQDRVDLVQGVELNHGARDWLTEEHKIAVAGTLDKIVESGQAFDVVVLFHVLEHVNDPIAFLQQISRVLAPRGRLVVEVPNVDDALLMRYELQDFADFYFSYAHLIYFSVDSLRYCLREAGFEGNVVGVQRYDLSNHMHWMNAGKPGGQGKYNDIFPQSLCDAYSDSIVQAGYADTLWAVVTLNSVNSNPPQIV